MHDFFRQSDLNKSKKVEFIFFVKSIFIRIIRIAFGRIGKKIAKKNIAWSKKKIMKSTKESSNRLVVVTFLYCSSISRKNSLYIIWYDIDTVWKLHKFTLTLFWQKFRKNNGFTNKITK